jgi:hypothetical protein
MQSFAELERRVDRALAALPPLDAPDTLLPRVLASVRAWAERPWYQRAWLTWPVGLQAASVAVLMLIVIGGALAFPTAQEEMVRTVAAAVQRTFGVLPDVGSSFGVTANALALAWRVIVQPLVPVALGLAVMAGVASALLVTVLNHVFPERSAHR